MAGGVLLLEDDDDVRESMTSLVTVACAREAVGVASLDELKALGPLALGCELAILDLHLGDESPTGIDAHDWLRRQGFCGRIVFLTACDPNHPLVIDAARLSDVFVTQKPIDIDELRAIVAGGGRVASTI